MGGEIKKTNYYYFVYKNQIEKKVAGYVKDWFGDFDYKIVNTTDTEDVMSYMKKRFKNLDDYLSASITIRFNLVIDAHDEEIKNAVAAKAEYTEKNHKIEYSIRIFAFLYEDDTFDSITEEDIKNMDTINSPFFMEVLSFAIKKTSWCDDS